MTAVHRATAFGLDWHADIALPDFDAALKDGIAPAVEVRRIDALPERAGGRPLNRGSIYPDGIRLGWEDEVTFDMHGGGRIGYLPGAGWRGALPASFYGTVAALTAAWRGLVPLHACAVELDGRAVLIAGDAGAGKSTLTAGLLEQGAGFVGDDLSAVSVAPDGPTVLPGRPAIRLHADVAVRMASSDTRPVPGDPRGKWVARPQRRAPNRPLALGAVLILGEPGEATATALLPHVFRRRWMAALPMHAALFRNVLTIAARVPLLFYPAQEAFSLDAQRRRAVEVAGLLRATLR